MTGNDIIAEARRNFGETTTLTLTDVDFQRWVNTALRNLYALLPLPELEVLAQESTVPLVAGRGPLPATLDHMLSVMVDGVPAEIVPMNTVQVIDRNPFFDTFVPIATTDGENLWVRPATAPAADITYIAPPPAITNFSAPVVLPKWTSALVLFTTAFAYAQEEDKGQAQHYRNEALALINRTYTAPEQEALQQ
jgi:hypothetical protein